MNSSEYIKKERPFSLNAHSLLRYFGIRGIAGTSFSLQNCRFTPETQKRPKPFPAVCRFRARERYSIICYAFSFC